MSLISVNNLTFYYEGNYNNVFENVTFQIDTNWKLGLIGRNGKGKTTLLQLLMNQYEYIGSIHSNEVFDYFPYKFSKQQFEKNVIEVLDELFPNFELWKICIEFEELNISTDILYQKLSTLSNGEQTKVMLSVLFSMENHFLLIDEPTNHLDQEARMLIHQYLNRKKGFILVSHDRELLNSCVDHILVINRSSISVEKGNFETWWENKKRKDTYEINQNSIRLKEIGKLDTASKQSRIWADKVESKKIGGKTSKSENPVNARSYYGEKSRKMQQHRKNIEKRMQNAMNAKQELLKDIEKVKDLKIITLSHYKDILISSSKFGLSYNNNKVFTNKNFEIRRGERVALIGPNGCGKSSILKYILGKIANEDIKVEGELRKVANLKISYVSQDTREINGDLESYAKNTSIDYTLFLSILSKLDVTRAEFEKDISQFSEGQKKKVLIAKSLSTKAHIYLWDEPLNYIDIFSRIQIEELVLKHKPTLLFVEHDTEFVKKISTKTIVL